MAAEPLIFERSVPGRRAFSLPALDVPDAPLGELVPEGARRVGPIGLPEVSERDLVQHFTRLSQRNFAVDLGFYPLGSCTMKYNPKVADVAAATAGLRRIHPLQPVEQVQGALELLWRMERVLCDLTGMSAVSFQPAAGAHGELAGLLMIRAYHASRGEDSRRTVLIPDSAHGTNPASVRGAGFHATTVRSNDRGLVDLGSLRGALGDDVAGLMLTNPNTLGLFEAEVAEIARLVHEAGGLLYYDGANFNAILGKVRPFDMGFDVVHLNLHKTFGTPHGGGGPGAGPVAVSERLAAFLPSPVVINEGGRFRWDVDRPLSIGPMHGFHGNFGVVVRAFAYVLALGAEGLERVAENAVLNANYLLTRLREAYDVPFDGRCMHEFVLSARNFKQDGIRAMDVAKALIDRGFHPPTVYFPLVVEEALMIEPTETEALDTLDAFADAMLEIADLARRDPEALRRAPTTTVVGRVDETRAARQFRGRWTPEAV